MEWKGARYSRRCVRAVVLAMLFVTLGGGVDPVFAQFDSGSSGIHGVFPPVPEGGIPSDSIFVIWNIRTGTVRYCSSYVWDSGLDACNPSGSGVVAQIAGTESGGPPTGVYEFEDFSLPAISGTTRYLVIVGHSPNTPLSILSEQNIDFPGGSTGSYNLYVYGLNGKVVTGTSTGFAAAGAAGGPGGFDGGASGNGGSTPSSGAAGFGPAGGSGGAASAAGLEESYGVVASAGPLNPSLTPLAGGSGGGGAAGVPSATTLGTTACGVNTIGYGGGPGGGGGGALLLAASNTVRLGSGFSIYAWGGNGGYNQDTNCRLWGGGGAGGSVRIVAQQVTGTGNIIVHGGQRSDGVTRASGGFVRIETASNQFTGSVQGAAGGSFVSFPTAPIPSNLPTLRIASVAGTAAPSDPTARLGTPDITFPSAIESEVAVVVEASNVPLATTVTVKVVPATGSPTSATTTGLAGTIVQSSAQANVALPPGAGVITASASFNVPAGFALNALPTIDGERPTQVEVVTDDAGVTRTYLIAKSGARFEIGQ